MRSFVGRVHQERAQAHETRRALFVKLEKLIGRPVVTYFTSFTYPVQIEDDDADILEDVLRQLDLSRGLALVISSPGGDGEAAERIVNICRNYSKTGEFWAIIPGKAKSAATMICFGASKIIMGPSSELGPVDPQIIFAEKGVRKQYSAYNIVTSYDELFRNAVSTPGHLEPYIQQLDHYDARDVQRLREAIELSDDIAVKTLRTGMMKGKSEKVVRNKIERFLQPAKTKSHGRPIFRDEARECGLKIADVDENAARWTAVHELYIRTNLHVSHGACKCVESAVDSFSVETPRRLMLVGE